MKKKRILRFLCSFALAIAALLTGIKPAFAYTAHTADEAIAWCYSKVGQPIGSGECVAFIVSYYQYLGVTSPGGNGADYTWNALPAGWKRIQGAQPQKGDILVYTGGYKNYGHVGIYESDRSTFHQNFGGARHVVHVTYSYNGLANPYWGVIRPDFGNSGQPSSAISWGALGGSTTETNANIQIRATASSRGTFTGAGVTIWDSAGNVVARKDESPSITGTYMNIFYNINDELHATLSPGQTYTCKFYCVYNGTRYESGTQSFTTKGSSASNISWGALGGSTTETNANIQIRATASSRGTFTGAGVTIWDSAGNVVARKDESPSITGTYMNIFYNINDELHATLSPGQTYTCKFYCVYNGTRYESGTQSFTTKGSSNVSVTGIGLSRASATLTAGSKLSLTATVSPSNATNKGVSWSSSNASVATVDSQGNVTAVKTGTATITARTNDGGKTASCTITVSPITIYRLYNPWSGEHFYTSSSSESNHLVSLGWNYEGVAWKSPTSSSTPVYRLYNPWSGDHHYTTDASERRSLLNIGWRDEGIGWYSDDSHGVPVYRLYNPYVTSFYHHYTTSWSECQNLISLGWRDEGIGWYGCK